MLLDIGGKHPRILDILNNGIIEIGIVRTPFNIHDFDFISLPSEPMVAAVTLHWDNPKDNIEVSDLADKPLMIYRRFEKLILGTCQKAGFEPRIICKTDDARSTLLWAESGIGLAVVPEAAIKLVGSHDLRYWKINSPALETQISAIWVKNRYVSSPAKRFLDTFKIDRSIL